MKKTNKLVLPLFLYLCILHPFFLYSQTNVTDHEEWLKQMQNEEMKISAYVDEQMKNVTYTDSIMRFFKVPEEHGVGESDLFILKNDYVKGYYRQRYLEMHPEVVAIYNPGRVVLSSGKDSTAAGSFNISCSEGNFESGIGSFTGYASPVSYTGGLCGFIPTTNVSYINVGFSTNNFLLTNNVADPIIPSLNQTNNSSAHAMRINASMPCRPLGGVNMLQKSFSSSVAGKARINFTYALVMEEPSHGSQNPFFVARVLNNAGVEVGTRVCKVAGGSDPFFQTTTRVNCNSGKVVDVVWRDWNCDYIEFDIEANKTYTIEFFVADCGQGGHYAYAYVDDICADVICCKGDVKAPIDLTCRPLEDGSRLSWDPVPGAAYYKVYMTQYDPACCYGPHPPYPISVIWNVGGTTVDVPTSFASCFSWWVVTVMPDSCKSPFSDKMCSCSPLPPAPENLICDPLEEGASRLSWDPVPGALYYRVFMTQYDPECCHGPHPPYPISAIWNVSGTTVDVPNSFASCFSWWVISVMPDSSRSGFSEKKCSCTPLPPPPDGLGCESSEDGSYLSWNPVPGALYYRVFMTQYDPECCSSSVPYPMSAIWNVSSTGVFVPTSFAYCFSWWVISVMPDSSRSDFSLKQCSCSPLPPPPDGLWCEPIDGSLLHWNPVAGAASYNVYIYPNDPACCSTGSPGTPIVINTVGLSIAIPFGTTSCFSWKVSTVMPNGYETELSESMCSCTLGGKASSDKYKPTMYATAIPNPASEYVEFTVNDDNKQPVTEVLDLYLYDFAGKEIIKRVMNINEKVRLNVQSYQSGIYVYEIRRNKKLLFKSKISVMRN